MAQQEEDLFRQIDETMEAERLQKLWEHYKEWLIGGLILFFAVLFAYVGWQSYREKQDQAAAELLLSALTAADKGDSSAAKNGLDNLLAGYGSHGYAQLAQMARAKALAAAGDRGGALTTLEQLAGERGTASALKGLAWLQAAYLTVDEGDKSLAYLARLEPDSPFRAHALELQGMVAARKGDMEGALARYREALAAKPGGALLARLNQRVERMGGTQQP